MEPVPMTADQRLHELVLDYIKLNFENSSRILDLGAGQGALTYQLLKNDYLNVTPVDITSEYWKLANLSLNIVDLNEDFHHDIDGQFDLICAVEIIEHLESPYLFLRNCHKLLNEKGILIVTTPNVESVESRLIFVWNGHFRFFSSDELFNHHVTPIFSWYLFHAFRKIGFNEIKCLYTEEKFVISNSFKAKIARVLFRPLKFLIKGSTKGENRIHIAKKGKYLLPSSK